MEKLRRLFNLELYFPVKTHRQNWAGGSDLLVATQFTDGDPVIAWSLDGSRIVLSSDAPPVQPVLVIGQAETDFSRAAAGHVLNQECHDLEDLGFCGGGGGGSGSYVPGIYMTDLQLNDLGEGWPRGDPEIEVMLISRSSGSGLDATYRAGPAANESAEFSRRFDMNDHSWQASSTNGVLIATKADLDAIKLRFPELPADSAPFTFAVWEDDDERGEIVQNDHWKDVFWNTVTLVVAGS